MPVLFGNTYMLPVIIVVVLLLLLLLVIMMRKRGAGTGAPKPVAQKREKPVGKPPKEPKPTKPKGTAAKVGTPVYMTQEPEEIADWMEEPASTTEVGPRVAEPMAEAPAAAPQAAQPPVAVPGPRQEASRLDLGIKSDPLHSVILDLLQGWGDVTDEDIKRLAVFRPDKVLATLQAMELPKELKSNQGARTRLIQLRQAGADLVEKEKKRQASAPTPSPKTPESEPEKRPLSETFPAFSLIPETPQPLAPAVEEAEAPQSAPTQAVDNEWSTAWQTTEPVEPIESAVQMPVEAEPVAPVWAEPVVPVETEPVMLAESEPVMLAKPPVAVGAEPQSSWIEKEVAPLSEWQVDEPSEFLESRDSLSSLHGAVKTADQLLSLPAAEQTEMVTFLAPEELAKAFEGTTDKGLKRAIIDTLEHVSNPASLDVLRRCLDDSDPEIQIYALEAADRLLGVD